MKSKDKAPGKSAPTTGLFIPRLPVLTGSSDKQVDYAAAIRFRYAQKNPHSDLFQKHLQAKWWIENKDALK